MQKRWDIAAPNLELATRLAQVHGLPLPVAQILINRSLREDAAIERFLKPSLKDLPDPKSMSGIEAAVACLVQAIREKAKITIYGDYDVDGTTATTLLVHFLSEVGAEVDFYIPHRMREGYSLNSDALRRLHERGTRVVVTVDNGISALREAQVARELGLSLIITDHHEVPEQIPDATAVVNPKQKGDAFTGKELAGVGVAFYLAIALRQALRENGLLGEREPNLRGLLDLVAVGTIADMAPLTGVNRILVKEGLRVASAHARPGLRALMRVSGIDGELSADQVAFRIGPRINAAGRLDDAAHGVQLLLSRDAGEAQALAERLSQANEERQSLEDQIVTEAVAFVESNQIAKNFRTLVLKNETWHPGVIGIVASRLVEKYYLPTIVLTRDLDGWKGSARSIRNLHLVDALTECRSALTKFGGHRYAAGLSLKTDAVDGFVEAFERTVRAHLKPEDFEPTLRVDACAEFSSVDPVFLEHLECLEPFGLGNPQPTWLFRDLEVRESRIVGEKHLRMRLGQGNRHFGAIGFRLGDKLPKLGSRVDIAGVLEWNEWNGNKNIQLRAIDLKAPA